MPKSRIRRRNAYVPPEGTPRAVRVGSPPWLVPLMVACFVLGLLWVVTYYVTQTYYPIGAIGLWNMAIGFGFIILAYAALHRRKES